MKHTKIIYSLLVIALMSTVVFACSKGNKDPKPPKTGSGNCDDCSFSATVAEASVSAYSATTAKAVWTKQTIAGSSTYTFYVAGEDETNKRLLHFFLNTLEAHEPGSYPISRSSNNHCFYIENYNTSGAKSWLAPGPTNDDDESFGTLVISEITATRAKGTFSVTTYEDINFSTTRTITNGSFDVPLSKQGF